MSELIAEPGRQEIVVTHVYNASPGKVFRALTEAQYIPQWWGPAYLVTEVEHMDARSGGAWRFVQSDAEGGIYAFHGVYHTVEAPTRVVYTFEYEGMPGHVLLETITLEPVGSRTKMTDQLVFQSVADRDGMLATGMKDGTNESIERLTQLLAKME